MLALLPRFWLIAGITLINSIINVTRCGSAERCVVKIDEAKRLFHVFLELMKRFELLGGRGKALSAGCLEKHLVAGAQQGGNFKTCEDAGFLYGRLVLPLITDDCADTVFCDLHAAIGLILGRETCLPQQIHALRKGGNLRAGTTEEHTISIGRRGGDRVPNSCARNHGRRRGEASSGDRNLLNEV